MNRRIRGNNFPARGNRDSRFITGLIAVLAQQYSVELMYTQSVQTAF